MAWRSPEVSRHDASRSTQVGPKILVPFKAIHALLRETLLLLRLDDDSVLYDSPLNEEGLAQAREGVRGVLQTILLAYSLQL